MKKLAKKNKDTVSVLHLSKGFTLLELLVVVLIIGIIAAIALPQYQYTVLKSKYTTLMNIAKAVKEAQERYFMAKGQYTEYFADLDVDVPDGEEGSFTGVNNENYNLANYDAMFFNNGNSVIILFSNQIISILLKDGDRFMDYNLRLDYSAAMWDNKRALCAAWTKSGEQGKRLCRELSNFPNTCGVSGSRYTCKLF